MINDDKIGVKNNQLKTGFIFIFILFLISWLYNYPKILFFPPYALHVWRQGDCLSFALNYYNENLSFWKPEINGLGLAGSGKTVSEFPIIYYLVAQLWKIFGQHEFIFRLINVSIIFFGLFNLQRLGRSILKDNFFSIFIPLFLFTSPILVYYSNNFLADAPAFGLALSGCYYLYRYISLSENKAFWYAFTLFLLGGLIKISSLLIFFSFTGAYTIELLLNYRSIDKRKLKTLILGFFGIIISIGAWYMYARFYNSQNNAGFFLQSIYPIWDLTPEERKHIFDCLYANLMPSFLNRIAFAVVLMLFISLIVFYKKVNHFLLLASVFCFIGVVAYILLWFKAFDVHDYYLTNLLIFIPLVLLTFFEFLNRTYPTFFRSPYLRVSLSLALVFLTYQTALKNRLKYDSRKFFARDLMLKKSDIDFWEWNHWHYGNNFKAFETVKPYLKSIGILHTDKVICLSDGSINVSLYLLDLKGYTRYGYAAFSDKERMEFAVQQNCKYLIITDEELKNTHDLEPFLTNKVGQYQNIGIYSLSNNGITDLKN